MGPFTVGSICDFCSDPHPVAVCGVRARPGGKVHFDPVYGWTACATCLGLIRAGQRDALRRHSADQLAEKYAVLPLHLLRDVGRAQSRFWAEFTGDVQPWPKQ